MFCPQCGAPNEEDGIFCGNCGAVLNPEEMPAGEAPMPAVEEFPAKEVSEPVLEVEKLPVAPSPPPPSPPRPRPAYSSAVQTSGMAIASLVTGIAGWTILPFVGSILAIIFGYAARKEIRRRPGELTGEGLAVAGLVMGWLAVALSVLALCQGSDSRAGKGPRMAAMLGILTAFGLSTSAGLNAYLPLLVVALLARFTDLITLNPPWDALESWWVIGALVVLLLIEILVDKVPAVDSINDTIQTFIRPVAGAILFAASAGTIGDAHPVLAMICGLVVAGGVHAAKATARPVITTTTGGLANPVVSTLEDVVSLVVAILSIVLPILVLFFLLLMVFFFVRWRRRRRSSRDEWSFEQRRDKSHG
jgi:hypothetical protein